MKKYMYVFSFAVLCAVFAWYHSANAASLTEQTSVLNGSVSWTINVGEKVKQGDSLVNITTLTGNASACRSSVDGTVTEVLVKPGDNITQGQVVVKVQN